MGKFEKFLYKRQQAFGEPMATITRHRSINLNLAVMNNYVKDNEYATLYYNREDLLIGIKFSKKKKQEAYKIRKYRGGKFGSITGMAFFKYYNIPHDETKAYNAKWDEQNEMLILDLKEHNEEISETEDEVPF